MAMTPSGEVYAMVHNLTAFCVAQTDDSTGPPSINEGYVIQAAAFRNKVNQSKFVLFKALVHPHESLVPGELRSERHRQAMGRKVEPVFGWIEVEAHALV
jgi:hypothetical protein